MKRFLRLNQGLPAAAAVLHSATSLAHPGVSDHVVAPGPAHGLAHFLTGFPAASAAVALVAWAAIALAAGVRARRRATERE